MNKDCQNKTVVERYCSQQIPEQFVSLASFAVPAAADEGDMGLNWPVSPNIVVGPQGRKPFFPAHSSGAVTYSLFVSHFSFSVFASKGTLQWWQHATSSCILKILRVSSKGKFISQCICEIWRKVKCIIFSLWVQFHKAFSNMRMQNVRQNHLKLTDIFWPWCKQNWIGTSACCQVKTFILGKCNRAK